MAEEMNQDNQKTIVSFVVGLLIGGLLVWAFSGPTDSDQEKAEKVTGDNNAAMEEGDAAMEEKAASPKLSVGSGEIVIKDQPASMTVVVEKAEYPVSEGWIGIRTFENDELSNILGVNRFSESQGLIPENIELVTPTISGKTYAVVVYEEDGDFDFSLAGDKQLETIFTTFTAE